MPREGIRHSGEGGRRWDPGAAGLGTRNSSPRDEAIRARSGPSDRSALRLAEKWPALDLAGTGEGTY